MKIVFVGACDKNFQNYCERVHKRAMSLLLRKYPVLKKSKFNLIVNLSNRLKTSAGLARGYRSPSGVCFAGEITLHYRLLKDAPDQIKSVYLHELAHIVAYRLYEANIQHGTPWKEIMLNLNEAPEVFHSMDVSRFKRVSNETSR